jgi:ABC-type Zn uptake system ZnuABC Zn-binding protein ZnuA
VRRLGYVTAALVLALAGCADPDPEPAEQTADDAGTDDSDAAEEAAADEPDAEPEPEPPPTELLVVSTVAPIADVVAEVLGDRGEVETLIPPGADSHTYEPRPGDVVPLSEADLFVGNGLGLNPASVALAEANLPEDAPLVLLGEVALDDAELSDEHWHDHGDGGHSHDGDGGHSHDEDGGHSHDEDGGHSHDDGASGNGVNPHVWTSVPNVLAYVDAVEDALVDLDPEWADHYAERADDYRAQLEDLDADVREAVDTLAEDRRRLVVYHDAWAYFGSEYGLEVIAAVQPSDYAEPSASDVRAIIDQIREQDVPAIFGAEEFPTAVTATIADETGADYVGELADDTLPGEPGDPDHSYIGMMRVNAGAIVDALGGDASALR